MTFKCPVFILWILILILSYQEQECCRFGPGPNCGFPCRCTGANLCDPDSGACIDGSHCQSVLPDGYGWQGQGCRIGNVAYGKTDVHQSGQIAFYTAELAVDGNTSPYITHDSNESCAYPFISDINSFAWWFVDLGNVFTIQSVSIVNRLTKLGNVDRSSLFRERSTDYDIRIGNISDLSQHTLCFHQGKLGDQVQPMETITCDRGDIVGRFVSFSRTGGQNQNQAAICEFMVMGYKVIECHPNDCNGACNSVIGCDKCVAGKMLPDCINVCPDGYWGFNCANTCGKCKYGYVCDKVTGSCGEQCKSWYIPELCSDELVLPPVTSNVELLDITFDAAMVSWDRSFGFNTDIIQYVYYIVQYRWKYSNVDAWFQSDRIQLSNETSFQYKLSGLEHNTEFEVQIVPYRALNGLTETGIIETTEFTTKCKDPDTPSTPSMHGDAGRFTVTWTDLKGLSSGCDRLESAAVIIKCENSTSNILSETYNIAIETNAFTYEPTNAISCSVVLSVSNNKGFSSASAKTSITRATTTVIDSASGAAQQVDDNGPNITAIIVGTVLGALVIILIAVIVALVLRIRRNMPLQGGAKTDINTAGKSNPVYENTTGSDNDDMKSIINPPVVYASVEETNTATAKLKVSMAPSGLYENTKVPELQYASLDDSHKNTTKPSPVYQELK